MWLGPNLDLVVQRNAVLPIGYQLIGNDDGAPIDLDGQTLLCRVKYNAGASAILATPLISIVNSSEGQFEILFDGRVFSSVPGTLEVVQLAYDVIATSVNDPICVMRGTFYLTPGVS